MASDPRQNDRQTDRQLDRQTKQITPDGASPRTNPPEDLSASIVPPAELDILEGKERLAEEETPRQQPRP